MAAHFCFNKTQIPYVKTYANKSSAKMKNRNKTMLPFSFKIEIDFGQNRH